jgi:hypothetical protein
LVSSTANLDKKPRNIRCTYWDSPAPTRPSELALGPLAPLAALDKAIRELSLPLALPLLALPLLGAPAGEGRTEPSAAEREGFEPSVPLQVHMISNPTSTDQDAAKCEKSREIGDPSGPQIGHLGPPVGQSWGNPVGQNRDSTDPVEYSLAKALEAAAVAGRFEVVIQLTRELEARRLARAGDVADKRSPA